MSASLEAADPPNGSATVDVLDALPVGVFITSATGEPSYANREAERLLGRSVVPGIATADLPAAYQAYCAGTDELYPLSRLPIGQALAGVASHVDDMEVLRPDGRIALEVWGLPVMTGDGTVDRAVLAFADVTARKRTEQVLASRDALLDLALDAIFVCGRDGRISYWNQGAEQMYGHSRADAEGQPASRLLGTELPETASNVEGLVAESGHWEGELVQYHRDGHAMTVEARIATYRDHAGTVVGTMEICRDVTARKAAEAELARRAAELKRSERQLAEAQALAHLGSWEWDIKEGRVRWSAELYRIFGEDQKTFVPTYENFLESVAAEDRATVATTIETAIAEGKPYHLVYGIIRPDGEQRRVDTKGRAVANAGDGGGFYVGTVLDVTDRHLSDLALRENEAAMVDAQRVAGVGSFTFDARTGAMRWTEEFNRIFGYPPGTPASVAGLLDRLHPEDLPRIILLWERAPVRLQPWSTEARIVLSDGAVRWVASRGEPVAGADGAVASVHGTVQDITERRAAREKMRFQAQLLDAVGDAVVASDLAGDILYWGPGAERLYGWAAEEVVGRPILEITPSTVSAATAAEIMDRLKQGQSWSGIVELCRRDRSTFLAQVTDTPVLAADGSMTAIIGISSDVTERETAKARMEQLLMERTVQNKGQAAVMNLGRAALAGAGGADIMAAAVELLAGTLDLEHSGVFAYDAETRVLTPEAVFPPDITRRSLPLCRCESSVWPHALSEGRPVVLHGLDTHELFPTGSFGGSGVWATITVRHRVFGGVAVSTGDATRVFSEHDLNLVASIANVIGSVIEREELDRLKSEFVSTVSHELRTPLSSVLGYLELLRSGDAGELSSEQSHMLDVIARNGERLLSLVQDLLSASRIDAGTMKVTTAPVDVGALIESATQAVAAPLAGRDLHMSIELDPGIAPIEADAEQLERALVNLLSNAIKFTPDGGSVTVRARQVASSAEIAIADTGIGIPKSEHERLFERFFRASTARNAAIQGTGLGLSIVKAIVEAHGGTVAITSESGAGTTVTVRMPLFAGGGDHRAPNG